MAKLILSTGNIVSGGPSIVRKPGAYRSNLELTHSLRDNILAAQEEYASAPPHANGVANGVANGGGGGGGGGSSSSGEDGNKNGEEDANGKSNGYHGGDAAAAAAAAVSPPASAWTERRGDTIYVPRIEWSAAGLQEEPDQYEITAKLFFLSTAAVRDRGRYAREALGLVLRELGVPRVDLLVVSFPGMSFEGDCEWQADKINATQGDDEEELSTWAALEPLVAEEAKAGKLGIAEFGSEKLARFLGQVKVRPAVDQINIKDCCNVPPPLAKLAKEQGIELLVHSDCTDVLPKGTLRELLGQGPRGARLLADGPPAPRGEGADEDGRRAKRQRLSSPTAGGPANDAGDEAGLRGDLAPQWVVKYTAVVKNRGVIENKGYFAGAELRDA